MRRSMPPLAAPRAGRGGGIFEENDGGDLRQISECSEICDVRIPSGASRQPYAQAHFSIQGDVMRQTTQTGYSIILYHGINRR